MDFRRIARGVVWGLFLLAVAFIFAGCAERIVYLPDGRVIQRREVMPQVGVILSVKNNCAASLEIERGGYIVDRGVPFGRSDRLPLSTTAFTGDSRQIVVTASAHDGRGRYLGSATRSFYIDVYRGTYEETWVVDRLESPPGAQCVVP